MKATRPISISSEEVMILQQICESGGEEIADLMADLRMNHQRVMQHIEHLKHKGLVTVQTAYDDWWVRTSTRGARLVRYMWPEMVMGY